MKSLRELSDEQLAILGAKIRERREALGLSQEDVAERAKFENTKTVSRAENGIRISDPYFYAICRVLGLDSEKLLGDFFTPPHRFVLPEVFIPIDFEVKLHFPSDGSRVFHQAGYQTESRMQIFEQQLEVVAEIRYREAHWRECVWTATGKLNLKDKDKFLAAFLELFKIVPLIRGKIELIPYDRLGWEVYFLSNNQLRLDPKYDRKMAKRLRAFRRRNPDSF